MFPTRIDFPELMFGVFPNRIDIPECMFRAFPIVFAIAVCVCVCAWGPGLFKGGVQLPAKHGIFSRVELSARRFGMPFAVGLTLVIARLL